MAWNPASLAAAARAGSTGRAAARAALRAAALGRAALLRLPPLDPSREGLQLLLGAAVGLATGVVAWALITGVHLVAEAAFAAPTPPWQVVAVPALGGLVVGLLVRYVVPEVSGGGVVATLEAVAIHRGRIRRRVAPGGVVATSVALGTGASGGREGPIVLLGGAVGSLIAGLGRLDEERTRSLVAAGVAAGIAASFNAPIGGMLFAIELLLGGLRRAGSLQVIVVAAVVSSVTARQLVGPGLPLFDPAQPAQLDRPAKLLVHAAIRLLALLVAQGFRRGVHLAGLAAARVRARVGTVATVGLGGLGVGLIALAVPEVLGEGAGLPAVPGVSREPIRMMLDGLQGTGWAAAGSLLVLLVAKLLASLVSIGTGSAVGTLAPTLFTGAALGAAVGAVVVPTLGLGSPTAYALVGMAAVFAAVVRAPLTAVILVFELTGDYELVLPLMLAVGIASFGADRLGWRSLYLETLRARGVTLARPDDVDVLQLVSVAEVMTGVDGPNITVPADEPADALRARFARASLHGAVVVDATGGLVGVVALSDLARTGATAADLATTRVATASPDEPTFRAVQRMANLQVGRLPVVDATTRRVVGVFRRADVVRAYDRGIERTVATRLTRDAQRMRDVTGLQAVELVVRAGSAADGRAVRDVPWPRRTVLTGVRRGTAALVPDGTTVLAEDDQVVALTAEPDEVLALLRDPAVVPAPAPAPDPAPDPDDPRDPS